jgi:hypothetical protein
LPLCQNRGGQCQDALQDADDHPGWWAAAVAFEVKLGLKLWLTNPSSPQDLAAVKRPTVTTLTSEGLPH